MGMAMEAGLAIGSAAFGAISRAIEARNERRDEKAALIEALERALVSSHRQEFPLTGPPQWLEPEPVNRRGVRRDHRRQALAPLGWWQLIRRGAAKRDALAAAERWCNEEDARRMTEERATYERECELWPGLQTNDVDAVLGALEDAFEDNAMPAFGFGCEGSVASVAMVSGSSGALPDETVQRDHAGKPSFCQRADALELHRDSVFSNALATVKETFAVAPALTEVQLLGLERREAILRKRDKLAPLCLIRATRAEMTGAHWLGRPRAIVDTFSDVRYVLDQDGRGLRALDLDDEPDVRAVLGAVAEALDCRC